MQCNALIHPSIHPSIHTMATFGIPDSNQHSMIGVVSLRSPSNSFLFSVFKTNILLEKTNKRTIAIRAILWGQRCDQAGELLPSVQDLSGARIAHGIPGRKAQGRHQGRQINKQTKKKQTNNCRRNAQKVIPDPCILDCLHRNTIAEGKDGIGFLPSLLRSHQESFERGGCWKRNRNRKTTTLLSSLTSPVVLPVVVENEKRCNWWLLLAV